MAEEITPPDLVGAGVASPQQPAMDPSSLMAAMRQPALPPDMAGLLAMPRQSPGQAYAQAAAGGVSAMTGAPNPVLQQQQFQQQQAQQYAQMAERVQSRRDHEAEGLLNISKDLLQSESEEARMVGARGLLNHAKSKGMQVGEFEPLVKAMATKRMNSDEMTEVLREISMGLDDATIALRHKNLPQPMLQQLRGAAKSDDTRRLLSLPTQRQEAKEIADLKVSEANAMEAESGLKGAPPELKFLVDQYHRKLALGKPYSEGTPETKRQSADLAYSEFKRLADEKAAVAAATEARKALAAERNNQLIERFFPGGQSGQPGQPGGPLSQFEPKLSVGPTGATIILEPRKPLSGEAMQQVTGIGGLRDAVTRLDVIRSDSKLRKSVEEFIGPAAQYKIALRRSTPLGLAGQVPKEVSDLQQNLARLENYTIRLITGAQMNLNEEGRIKKELPTMDLPTNDFWNRYDTARENVAMMEKRILGLALTGNQQAAAIAQELGLQIPGRTNTSPLTPARPVSPDGKHEWDGKAWIPR